MKRIAMLPALLLVLAGGAQAGESLSCRIKAGQLDRAIKPVVAEFTWSTAHGGEEVSGPMRTSIGQIDQGAGSGYTTAITLNGKPIEAPATTAGLIRFGKAYDFNGTIAIAYLVEREDDSSAAPSQVVLLLDKNGAVSETDILPGTAASTDGHCALIE